MIIKDSLCSRCKMSNEPSSADSDVQGVEDCDPQENKNTNNSAIYRQKSSDPRFATQFREINTWLLRFEEACHDYTDSYKANRVGLFRVDQTILGEAERILCSRAEKLDQWHATKRSGLEGCYNDMKEVCGRIESVFNQHHEVSRLVDHRLLSEQQRDILFQELEVTVGELIRKQRQICEAVPKSFRLQFGDGAVFHSHLHQYCGNMSISSYSAQLNSSQKVKEADTATVKNEDIAKKPSKCPLLVPGNPSVVVVHPLTNFLYHFINWLFYPGLSYVLGSPRALTVLRHFRPVAIDLQKLLSPGGLTCNKQGDLIIAFPSSHRIQVHDINGRFKFGFGGVGKEKALFLFPSSVAYCAKTGLVWFSAVKTQHVT